VPAAGAAALALLALLAAGCGGKKGMRAPRVPVTVATVQQRAIPLQIIATGTVEPVQTADVGSQVGGVVTRILFQEGHDVRAGQPLIQLDPRAFRAALEQALGVLGRDRAQWENARLEVERAQTLLDQNVISSSDYDQKRAAADAARAAVSADSGTVANARLNLQYSTIRAPISGRTGDLKVHVGDLVKAATSEPLVTINQLRPIYVRFAVPERELPQILRYRNANPRVVVRAPDDTAAVTGRLAFVDNAVDPASGTLLLKGEFANQDGGLWPGEFVEARLVLTVEPHAIVVPAPAVATGQQGTYVYVLNADSTATPRPVAVARMAEDVAVVARGLKPGEVVVTDGQFRLSPGARVLVRKGAPNTRP
jgi:multidrug efflux system membrane fusion protein